MKTVSYFRIEDLFVAVAASNSFYTITETVYFFELSQNGCYAKIEYNTCSSLHAEWYMANGYQPCTKEEYLAARYKAQAALAEFFGEQPEYTGLCRPLPVNYKMFESELFDNAA